MPTELFAISTSYHLTSLNSLLFSKVFLFVCLFEIEWNCICGFSHDKIVNCIYLNYFIGLKWYLLLSHLYKLS